MANKVNKTLLQTILTKRQNSEQLSNEEEAYAREIFSTMMGSKKQVRKVVRIVTGEQLRKEASNEIKKGKVDAEATRKDPRYTEGKNPAKIEGENSDPKIEALKGKLPDADEKPKTGGRYEHERLAEMTQEPIGTRSEAAKFVSANPVKAGDIVSKNMMKTGTRIVKGVIIKVKDGIAFVKWADGRMMYEQAHLLVKVKQEDPKLGPSDKEEKSKNVPMTKKKKRVTLRQGLARHGAPKSKLGRRIVHEVARRGGFGRGTFQDPVGRNLSPKEHATESGVRTGRAVRGVGRRVRSAGQAAGRFASGVARGVGRRASSTGQSARAAGRSAAGAARGFASGFGAGVKPRKPKVQKGDMAAAPNYGGAPGQVGEMQTTPFQDLTNSLQDVVRLAGQLKEKQEKTTDKDMKNHYDELINKLRDVAETILAGLNAELDEASNE